MKAIKKKIKVIREELFFKNSINGLIHDKKFHKHKEVIF